MESTEIEQRLAAIEARLTKIEGEPTAVSPQSQAKLPQAQESPDDWDFESSEKKPGASKALYDLEDQASEPRPGNWLGIIAVICFVLAAGFIIKLSIDSGWLTPARQIGMAALFGLSLIGAGFTLLRTDRSYASLLPGAGVVILYLTVFAAHRYYGLVPFEGALGLTAAVSGICLWLYTKIKHDVYPVTAAVGAYVAPVILGLHAEAVFSLYYFLLCSISFATLSVFLFSRALMLVAAYLAIAVTAFVGFDLRQDSLLAIVLAVHFLIFSVDSFIYTRQSGQPLSESEAWCFMPVLLIFYAVEYYLIDRIHPGFAPWFSLAFAGFLVGLYLVAKKTISDNLGSQSLILAYATVVGFHSVYLKLLPDDLRPWLFVLIMVAGAFAPVGLVKKSGTFLAIPGLALLAILVIEYLTMVHHLLGDYSLSWLGVSFAAVAGLWFVLIKDGVTQNREAIKQVLLGAAHILAILAFYRLTTDVGSLAVSASWLFYAVAVIALAFARQDQMMAKSALFVLGFAAAKALLYDAESAPTVVRIVCLMLTGAVLYGCGFFMRLVANWKEDRIS